MDGESRRKFAELEFRISSLERKLETMRQAMLSLTQVNEVLVGEVFKENRHWDDEG